MESIFFEHANIQLESINDFNKNTMASFMGIEFIELGNDYLKAKMIVGANTVQPLRILNGGASLAMSECVGSMAANLVFDRKVFVALGLDLNGNHLRPVMEGETVFATAKPIHIGKTTQVWEIRITNQNNVLAHISRLTMAVKKREEL